MAPYFPDEVDVFTIPHCRMKKLVDGYLNRLSCTDFTNEFDIKELLKNLLQTFIEFKNHEQIENEYIMKTLKRKMRALHVSNTAVCNCHSDNRLMEIMNFFKEGLEYHSKSNEERTGYAAELRGILGDFTQHFLPHMQEEEEIFQPLLIEYFDYDELCALKEIVLREHHLRKPISKYDSEEKIVRDEIEKAGLISSLPPEILLKIFSYLNPKDLCRCVQVEKAWSALAMDGQLWTALYPTMWAHGYWTFDGDSIGSESDFAGCPSDECVLDDDADVDEASEACNQMKKEAKMLLSLTKYCLPFAGQSVEKIDLSYNKGITNAMVHKILKICPNISHINLSHTRINDLAFKGLNPHGPGSKLKTLILSGCENIEDGTLTKLSAAAANRRTGDTPIARCTLNSREMSSDVINSALQKVMRTTRERNSRVNERDFHVDDDISTCHCACRTRRMSMVSIEDHSIENCNGPELVETGLSLEYLDLSGCYHVTDEGILSFYRRGGFPRLRYLDLSGCPNVSGEALSKLTSVCPALEPEYLFYCDNIQDGPYTDTANGCQNLECPNRMCCRS